MNTILDPRTHDEILRRIDALTPESRRQWGRMSVGGMVCHLNDAFEMVLGEREASLRPTLLFRTVVRFVAFSTPLPWPKGSPTAPEADQEQKGTPPGDFEADREKLRVLVERFTAAAKADALAPHPLFGRLSRGEWGRWAYRHTDHHLRQFGV
jgi:hypothetical protein